MVQTKLSGIGAVCLLLACQPKHGLQFGIRPQHTSTQHVALIFTFDVGIVLLHWQTLPHFQYAFADVSTTQQTLGLLRGSQVFG